MSACDTSSIIHCVECCDCGTPIVMHDKKKGNCPSCSRAYNWKVHYISLTEFVEYVSFTYGRGFNNGK